MEQSEAGFPAGHDQFTDAWGKGNMLSFDAENWETLSDYNIQGDWNIEAYLATGVSLPPRNELLGYNLWRNGDNITYIIAPDTLCIDSNLYPGEYEYHLSAVYNEGESFTEGPAHVTIIGTGYLSGYVFDHETGSPLDHATVSVQGSNYGITGFDGWYMIADITAGTYDVTCEASGYIMNTIFDVVIEYQGTTALNFEMEKDSIVNLPVYDSRENAVRIYPNPLRGYLNIESDGNFREIYLVNYLGRQIIKENIADRKQIQINTSILAAGVYFIQCYSMGGNVIVKKIVLLR
jgi:hypothetical protein